MKKKILLALAVLSASVTTAVAQDTIPTLAIDSTLTVGDSAIFKDVRVAGNTRLSGAVTAREFIVEQNALFYGNITTNGNIIYNNTPAYTGDVADIELIVRNPITGMLEKSGLQSIAELSYSKQCTTVSGNVPSPTWQNGTNKIYNDCQPVKVGVGTNDPQHKLDVRGIGAFSTGVLAGNVLATNYTNSALFEGLKIEGVAGPLMRLAVRKTDGTNEVRFRIENSGEVYATAVRVRLAPDIPIPDYVFKTDYQLMPLAELKKFVATNSHLPNIPSEQDIREDGLSLEEMQLKLLEKIEELTLYTIQLNERNEQLAKEIEELKNQPRN